MGIVGAHVLLYTPEAEALRTLLRDALGWEHVDAGDGWLIFELPPAELGVHPAKPGFARDFSLMCDDVESTIRELRAKGIEFDGDPEDVGYGNAVTMLLPGGAEITLYEPRHPTAI